MIAWKASIGIIGLAFVLSSAAALAADATGEASYDWNQWRGPNRNAIAPNSPILTLTDRPTKLWQSEFLPSQQEGGFGSPAVAGGRVYCYIGWRNGYPGLPGPRDVFICLDAVSGKTVWKVVYPGFETDHCASSFPTVADGKVYGCGAENLYCLDATDGKIIWKSEIIGKQLSSSPLLLDGMVLISGNSLYAYDAATGKEIWRQDKAAGGPSFEGVPHTSCNTSPVLWVKDGVKYVLNCGEKLTCVDPKTGEVKWQAPGPEFASTTPSISGDYVVINYGEGRGTYAYKMSADKVDELWHNQKGDRGATQVILDGYVYAFYKPGGYFCNKLETGEQKWMVRMGGGECSSPVIVDGKVFGLINDGGNTKSTGVVAFLPTPDKYTELVRFPVNAIAAANLVIVGGKLFVREHEGISCYDLTRSAPPSP